RELGSSRAGVNQASRNLIMSRLRIRDRIARKTRALVTLQCRAMFELYSEWWFAYNMTFIYAMARLEVDDTPTSVARRDVTAFFSPQDCVNFLRFTSPQIMLMLELLLIPPFIRTDCGFVVTRREALC
ncbi:unnamed protein product, partial [Pylaiella littoralis]